MDDKNQQSTDTPSPLTPGQPPTSSGSTPPPILTGEEPPAPPLPASQPSDQPKPPTIAPSPLPDEEMPPAMGPNEVIPPIITPPQKSRKKLIGGILAVLLLTAGVIGGTVLVGRSQEVREKAAGECRDNPVDPPTGYQWTATCGDEGACTSNADCPRGANNQEGWCYGFETGSRCLRLDQLSTPTPTKAVGGPVPTATPTTTPVPGEGGDGACPELARAGALVRASDGKTLGNQDVAPCNIVASFVSQWSDMAGRRWAAERTCQTSSIPAASDGQAIHDQPANVVQAFIDTHGRNACQKWVEEHNREIGQVTASSCTEVRIYKHPYGQGDRVSTPYGGKVKAGDAVKFCIVGSVAASGAPEVNINGSGWVRAAQSGPAGESCYQYDIPTDATQIRVEGRI